MCHRRNLLCTFYELVTLLWGRPFQQKLCAGSLTVRESSVASVPVKPKTNQIKQCLSPDICLSSGHLGGQYWKAFIIFGTVFNTDTTFLQFLTHLSSMRKSHPAWILWLSCADMRESCRSCLHNLKKTMYCEVPTGTVPACGATTSSDWRSLWVYCEREAHSN